MLENIINSNRKKCLKIAKCSQKCFSPKLCICFKNVTYACSKLKLTILKSLKFIQLWVFSAYIFLCKHVLNYSELKGGDGILILDLS